jgi:hypothetical protein
VGVKGDDSEKMRQGLLPLQLGNALSGQGGEMSLPPILRQTLEVFFIDSAVNSLDIMRYAANPPFSGPALAEQDGFVGFPSLE